MDQRENELFTDLLILLETEFAKPRLHIQVNYRLDPVFSMHSYAPQMIQGHGSQASLTVDYYLDQLQIESRELDVLHLLEKHIFDSLLKHVNGQFTQRVVEPFRSHYATQVRYHLTIPDMEYLSNTVPKLARIKADREFTKALEAKLSED